MKKDALYVYGKHPVDELLTHDLWNVAELYIVEYEPERDFIEQVALAKKRGIPVRVIGKGEAIDMVGEVNTQRILARIKDFHYQNIKDMQASLSVDEPQLVVVLDKLEDVHNFGAIIRSAAAAGASAVCVASAHQAPVSGAVFKTSAGAVSKLPIIQVANIADTLRKLKDYGFWIYALEMAEGTSQDMYTQSFDKKTVLVVGGEGRGVSPIVQETADFLVHIPMENEMESLNASVATALAMYEWKRQIAKAN